MSEVDESRQWGGQLGDGESSEGTLTVSEFLKLYPQGIFRPEPLDVVIVHGVPLPAPVARAIYEQESRVQ